MSIKKTLTIINLVLYSFSGIGQDKCMKKEEACLNLIIQRNFIISEDSYVNNLSEYFILDIKLNEKTDSIFKVEYFAKKESLHSSKIDSICEVIKRKWKPQVCGYKRIVIPLFILFSSADSINDYPINFTLKAEKEYPVIRTYLFKTVIINIQPRVKK